MFDDLKEAIELFETHVPFSDATFLILKAHLVIEVHLLRFIGYPEKVVGRCLEAVSVQNSEQCG